MTKQLSKPFYYVTLFKIEGHETWRVHTGTTPDDLDSQMASNPGKIPTITARKILKINRMDAEIEMKTLKS